jgi:hypothetical protein
MMKFLRRLGLAIGALTLSGGVLALGNYSLTQGSGTTFASVVVSSTHYAAYMLCDFVAGESQCAGVNSSGQIAIQAPPSLPLPTGASTSALQTTGNSTLSTINTTLGSPMQNSGGSVTANLGTLNGAATAANQTNASQKTQVVDGSGNVIASTSNALNVDVTNANANGQATMANSSPVVIASNQSAVPITGIATPLNVTLAPTVTYSALVKGVTAAITNTASTLTIAAVTSQRIYLTHISCNNTATATPTLINVQDGSGGTTIYTIIAPAGGGDTEVGTTPLTWTTAGNGLYVAPVTTGTSTICNASGYSSAN